MRPRVVSGGVAALGSYVVLSAAARPWLRTWGATDAEARETLAGDTLVAEAAMQTTRAITIDTPREDVWPWLMQMGQGRGGLYTYTWVENALRADIHNLDRIAPELQKLEPGDRVRLTPDPYLGRLPGQHYTVTEIRPGEALVMIQQLPNGALSSWSFVLREQRRGTTRLLVRARAAKPERALGRIGRALELLLLEPGYFAMERGMLRGIKRRAERLAGHRGGSWRVRTIHGGRKPDSPAIDAAATPVRSGPDGGDD